MRPLAAFLLLAFACIIISYYLVALDIGLTALKQARDMIVEQASSAGIPVELQDYAGYADSLVRNYIYLLPVACLGIGVAYLLHSRWRH